MQNLQNFIWIDLEMIGFDLDWDVIIEMVIIVIDSDFNILVEGLVIVIYQLEEIFVGMDEWNICQYGQFGLIQRVWESIVSMVEVEVQILVFFEQWVFKCSLLICGNSICQDCCFFYRYMFRLEGYFYYCNFDVFIFKELVVCWVLQVCESFKKGNIYLVLDDICELIVELCYYCDYFIKF